MRVWMGTALWASCSSSVQSNSRLDQLCHPPCNMHAAATHFALKLVCTRGNILMLVCRMQEKFQLEMEDSWVLEMDSSSPHKFSRHVIVKIPGAAFQNNFHVGAFVKDMYAAQEGTDPESPVQQLLINKVKPQPALSGWPHDMHGLP